MARSLRTRSRTLSLSGSRDTTLNGVVKSSLPSSIVRSSSCTDFHGRPLIPGTLSSTQWTSVPVLNGEVVGRPIAGQANGFRYNNFPITPDLNGVDTAPLGVPGGWELTTVARTNPSRPVVTPLTLIQDFVELPSQLKLIGKLLTRPKSSMSAKELANHHLAVKFGWLPLISDVKQLLDLQQAVLRRTAELKRLYSGTGLRRRVILNEDHQVSDQKRINQTIAAGQAFNAYYDITVGRRTWATIHWKPTVLPPNHPDDAAMARRARQIVLGLTPEGLAKGTWDIIPWTWLLGWFSNVGDFLLAFSNTVPASHSEACLMNEVIATGLAGPVTSVNTLSCDIYWSRDLLYTSKTRLVSGSIVPGFSLPFIGNDRLSILGSLFVQRFLR